MSKVIEYIKLPQGVCSYMQMIDIDLAGYKSLVKSIIINPKYPYDEKKFKYILKKHKEAFREKSVALEELRVRYLPDKYKTPEYKMTILYNESYLEVSTVDGGCSACL